MAFLHGNLSNPRHQRIDMSGCRIGFRARATVSTLLLLSASPATGQAQFANRASAYLARIHSPAGSIPPAMLGTTLTAPQRGPGVQISFAIVKRPDATFADDSGEAGAREQVYAVGADVPLPFQGVFRAARLGGSVGVMTVPCGGGRTCSGYMIGTHFRGSFLQIPLNGDIAHAPVLGIAVSADLGLGQLMSETSSAGFGLPISIAFRSSNHTSLSESDPRFQPRTILFIQPTFVRGSRETEDGADAGSFLEVTAGVSVLDFGFGGGASIIARKASVETTGLSAGVMFSWRSQR